MRFRLPPTIANTSTMLGYRGWWTSKELRSHFIPTDSQGYWTTTPGKATRPTSSLMFIVKHKLDFCLLLQLTNRRILNFALEPYETVLFIIIILLCYAQISNLRNPPKCNPRACDHVPIADRGERSPLHYLWCAKPSMINCLISDGAWPMVAGNNLHVHFSPPPHYTATCVVTW